MSQYNKKLLVLLIILLPIGVINSQTCGFGCLGLSGVYGGYSYQFYKPDGLNKHLNNLAAQFSNGKTINYERGEGFRIGANIFRAQFDNYFLTAKGYYQFLKEEQDIKRNNEFGNSVLSSTLEMNHWGLGIDVGVPLFKFLSWKIVEGGITFYTTDLAYEYNVETLVTQSYESPDVNVGYYVGTGLIIELVPDYISLEGSAFYNQVSIDDLIDDEGNYLFGENSGMKIIEKGNLSATVQLNIGVPF